MSYIGNECVGIVGDHCELLQAKGLKIEDFLGYTTKSKISYRENGTFSHANLRFATT